MDTDWIADASSEAGLEAMFSNKENKGGKTVHVDVIV